VGHASQASLQTKQHAAATRNEHVREPQRELPLFHFQAYNRHITDTNISSACKSAPLHNSWNAPHCSCNVLCLLCHSLDLSVLTRHWGITAHLGGEEPVLVGPGWVQHTRAETHCQAAYTSTQPGKNRLTCTQPSLHTSAACHHSFCCATCAKPLSVRNQQTKSQHTLLVVNRLFLWALGGS
jgi:hypothetical protein